MIKNVGTIKFGNKLLDVYGSLDQPLFRASDVADMIGYSEGNTWSMLQMCEIVEQFEDWDHQLDDIYFDDENGMLMRSVTVQGGDVIQIPYEEK